MCDVPDATEAVEACQENEDAPMQDCDSDGGDSDCGDTVDGGEIAEESSTALTVDEAADLLEYVAAARFVAQLIAEPVVAAGIETGRWASTERLAAQGARGDHGAAGALRPRARGDVEGGAEEGAQARPGEQEAED
eukprot:jgi/Undpi1/9213/HiC_scaffold_26.g11671.m1